GTGFTGATRVLFGGTQGTSLHVLSATSATVISPPRAAGAVNVTITTPGGTSAAAAGNKFTYTKTPAVRAIASFSNSKSDGAKPAGWLVADSKGVLYGTTLMGGTQGLGTVFSLTPKTPTSFTKKILHSFVGTDGATPYDGAVIDSSGALYLTTAAGG